MASHEVTIRENTGATKDAAPYLGNYASKETVRLEAGSGQMSAKCGLPPIQVLAILSGCFEAIEALERESLVRVHTDIGVICGVITGSFPTADAPFDRERNSLQLALRPLEGFDKDGNITICHVISCTGETSGIGTKVKGESFLSQFDGKGDMGGVDTISGATISSSAFLGAIEDAFKVLGTINISTEVDK